MTVYHKGKEIGGMGWVNGEKKYQGFVGSVYFEVFKLAHARETLMILCKLHVRKRLGKWEA